MLGTFLVELIQEVVEENMVAVVVFQGIDSQLSS
jgi:hypothetical protein